MTMDAFADQRQWWALLGRIVAAHTVMLHDTAVLDDQLAGAILSALDGVSRGEPPAGALSAMIVAFDERLDATVPAGAAGASAIARAEADVIAALLRLRGRDGLLALAGSLCDTRSALVALADEHLFTLMPVFAAGRPVEPTSFAHFLGGVIGPLARATPTVIAAYQLTNQSPLGAAHMTATGWPVDREQTAAALGFTGPVLHSFDSVAAIDFVHAVAASLIACVTPPRRLLRELAAWQRTTPPLLAPADGQSPAELARLERHASLLIADAQRLLPLVGDATYEPAAPLFDQIAPDLGELLERGNAMLRRFTSLVSGPLAPNRAALANRAGRDHTTSSDLADFLMTEEQVPPAAARAIRDMTIRTARDQGLEANAITPAMVDGAALMILGRELGIEAEAIGRYLAPRRFLERRGSTGGPAPEATRAWLDLERTAIESDQQWVSAETDRITQAATDLDRAVEAIVRAGATG